MAKTQDFAAIESACGHSEEPTRGFARKYSNGKWYWVEVREGEHEERWETRYYALNPKTGKPWQATRFGARAEFGCILTCIPEGE